MEELQSWANTTQCSDDTPSDHCKDPRLPHEIPGKKKSSLKIHTVEKNYTEFNQKYTAEV